MSTRQLLIAFAWLVVIACSSGTTTELTPTHAAAMRDSVQSMLDDFRRYAARIANGHTSSPPARPDSSAR